MNYIPTFFKLIGRNILISLSKKTFLKHVYKKYTGKVLNLKNPKSFSEKLQWLKLNDKNPAYTIMVDKVLVKEYIKERLGESFVVPLLGVWERPEEIDFDNLPNQFVLKTNHNSMTNVIVCKDKTEFDKSNVIKVLNRNLKTNFYRVFLEWPYKNVKRKVFAEKYLQDNYKDCLTDFKFFCFNGEAKFMYISNDGSDCAYTDIFDMNFNHLPFTFKDGNAPIPPKKPLEFDEMKLIAEKISRGIPHLRVDFYLVNGHIYIGELTFFHNGGMFKTNPQEWDYIIGDMLKLPEK